MVLNLHNRAFSSFSDFYQTIAALPQLSFLELDNISWSVNERNPPKRRSYHVKCNSPRIRRLDMRRIASKQTMQIIEAMLSPPQSSRLDCSVPRLQNVFVRYPTIQPHAAKKICEVLMTLSFDHFGVKETSDALCVRVNVTDHPDTSCEFSASMQRHCD